MDPGPWLRVVGAPRPDPSGSPYTGLLLNRTKSFPGWGKVMGAPPVGGRFLRPAWTPGWEMHTMRTIVDGPPSSLSPHEVLITDINDYPTFRFMKLGFVHVNTLNQIDVPGSLPPH